MSAPLLTTYFVLQALVLVLTGLPLAYLFFFSVAGIFYRLPRKGPEGTLRKMAVLIPAYREDAVIVESARDALRQDYPKDLFSVVVIADSLQQATLDNLRGSDITVIEVQFDKSTKTKALNRAMEQLGDAYDLAIVLDADNIMAKDFLRRINASFSIELACMQGHRLAKNVDTPLAVLDAASEEINNHIFRKGHRAVGLSSAIIGSGMAFRYGFFKEMMSGVKAVGGFDKEIELKMLEQGLKIGYDDGALVYDEKIRKAEAFTNQRRRWLSAQFAYLRKDLGPAFRELLKHGNIDYFDKVIQFMLPPRILLLGAVIILTTIFTAVNLLTESPAGFQISWVLVFLACLAVFALSVPCSFYNVNTLKALFTLPRGMFLMLLSLARVKGANREFLHTEHGPVVTASSATSNQNINQP